MYHRLISIYQSLNRGQIVSCQSSIYIKNIKFNKLIKPDITLSRMGSFLKKSQINLFYSSNHFRESRTSRNIRKHMKMQNLLTLLIIRHTESRNTRNKIPYIVTFKIQDLSLMNKRQKKKTVTQNRQVSKILNLFSIVLLTQLDRSNNYLIKLLTEENEQLKKQLQNAEQRHPLNSYNFEDQSLMKNIEVENTKKLLEQKILENAQINKQLESHQLEFKILKENYFNLQHQMSGLQQKVYQMESSQVLFDQNQHSNQKKSVVSTQKMDNVIQKLVTENSNLIQKYAIKQKQLKRLSIQEGMRDSYQFSAPYYEQSAHFNKENYRESFNQKQIYNQS